jgi:membrane protease YdiL (CAAX protease family)
MNVGRTLLTLGALFVGGYLIVSALPVLDYLQALVGSAIATVGFIFLGRGVGRGGRSSERLFVALDFTAVALIAVFVLTMILGALAGILGADQTTINLTEFLLEFEFAGIIMAFVSGVLRILPSISRSAFDTQLIYIVANFAGFFVLNLAVPPTTPLLFRQSVSPGNPFVTVMIAVPEESVFRLWLAPWLGNVSKTGALGGSFMSAILFAVYHLFVYGTHPVLLGIVFGAGLITAFSALKTRVLSVTIIDHLANNFISVSGL